MNKNKNIKNILFISNKSSRNLIGGRENLSHLIEKTLKNIFGDNFFSLRLEKKKITSLKDIYLALFGNIDGINSNKIKIIKNLIKNNKINYIFIDGSNLGKIPRKIVSKDVKIITFCHNVETNFFLKQFITCMNL